MLMTDAEILSSWSQALDKKKQVQILADLNACGVWEMMQKLTELQAPDLDRRWYQNMNPSRKQARQNTAASAKKAAPVKEAPDRVEPAPDEKYRRLQLIEWFCGNLKGSTAYLVGRFVDMLFYVRETGDADKLLEYIKKLTN